MQARASSSPAMSCSARPPSLLPAFFAQDFLPFPPTFIFCGGLFYLFFPILLHFTEVFFHLFFFCRIIAELFLSFTLLLHFCRIYILHLPFHRNVFLCILFTCISCLPPSRQVLPNSTLLNQPHTFFFFLMPPAILCPSFPPLSAPLPLFVIVFFVILFGLTFNLLSSTQFYS